MSLWGCRRIGDGTINVGEWLVFNNPLGNGAVASDNEILVAPCVGCAGDTICIDPKTIRKVAKSTPKAYQFLLPEKGHDMKLNSSNAYYLCQLMNAYEGCTAHIHSGKILLGKHPISSYRFMQNYCAVSLTGKVVVIPQKYLIGRAISVIYSVDGQQTWHQTLRRGRFMLWLNNANIHRIERAANNNQLGTKK